MKIDTQRPSEVQTIGDIRQNKVGIDTKNLSFITSLLTTNLYSQPLISFVRETVANGWDSQVEAGTTDQHIIVLVYPVETNDSVNQKRYRMAIRDHGTGLSPERFREIYCNIGSSTKRDSNDFIGAMGIGRFSALSVANTVELKSFYNRKIYSYMMYQDNMDIHIDQLDVRDQQGEPTTGMEISILLPKLTERELHDKLHQTLLSICPIPNVFYSIPQDITNAYAYHQETTFDRFNCKTIIKSKYYSYCSYLNTNEYYVSMGNILYPIDKEIVKSVYLLPNQSYCIFPEYFIIEVPIGSLDITPNREALLYSEKTQKTLSKYLLLAVENVLDDIKKNFNPNFTSFDKFFAFSHNKRFYFYLNKDTTRYLSLSKEFVEERFHYSYTLNGMSLMDNKGRVTGYNRFYDYSISEAIDQLECFATINIKTSISIKDGMVFSNTHVPNLSFKAFLRSLDDSNYYIFQVDRFTEKKLAYLKYWFKQNHGKDKNSFYNIIIFNGKFDWNVYKQMMRKVVKPPYRGYPNNTDIVLKQIIRLLFNTEDLFPIIKDGSDSEEFKTYYKNLLVNPTTEQEKAAPIFPIEQLLMDSHKYRLNGICKNNITFRSVKEIQDDTSYIYIYGNKTSIDLKMLFIAYYACKEFLTDQTIISHEKIKFIRTNQQNFVNLKKLSNCIYIKDYLKTSHQYISLLATVKYLGKNVQLIENYKFNTKNYNKDQSDIMEFVNQCSTVSAYYYSVYQQLMTYYGVTINKEITKLIDTYISKDQLYQPWLDLFKDKKKCIIYNILSSSSCSPTDITHILLPLLAFFLKYDTSPVVNDELQKFNSSIQQIKTL